MRLTLFLFLTFSLTLFSCQEEKKSFTLEGNAVGFADGAEIIAYTFENRQAVAIDTLIVENEKFSGTYPFDNSPQVNFLRSHEVNGSVIYFPENKDMKATLYRDSIHVSRVTGGKQNDAYSEYLTEIGKFNIRKQANMEAFRQAQQNNDVTAVAQIQSQNLNLTAEETKFKKEFLKKHDMSLFSIMLISEMLSRGETTPAEAKTYLQDLRPEIASSEFTKELETTIAAMGKAEIGSLAPEFTAPTPEGTNLSLSETLGKYTIIDFWASWCRPCRIENPNVVRVYNKYHEKGLNIISVSLDKADQRDKWIQAIKDDQMDWYHVSNLQFWNDPIAKQYNIRSIPATFLLDENGIIIDKNLRGAALEAKMASLFAED